MPYFSHVVPSTIFRTLHHRLLMSMKPISPSRSVGDGSCEKHLISGIRSDSNEVVHEDEYMVGVQRYCGSVRSYIRYGCEKGGSVLRLRAESDSWIRHSKRRTW